MGHDSNSESEIEQLRKQVSDLKWLLEVERCKVISMAPVELMIELRSGYLKLSSWQEFHLWEAEIEDKVIGYVRKQAAEEGGALPRRLPCPLCRSVPSNAVEPRAGFVFPDGLRLHLRGDGRVGRCAVIDSASELVKARKNGDFNEHRRLEAQAESAALAKRRESEVVYRTSPDSIRLVDQDCSTPRTPESLQLMEQRMREMGLEEKRDANVIEWSLVVDEHTVYADHREHGIIRFAVYRIVKRKGRRQEPQFIGSFSIKDMWKNDMQSKFTAMLNKVLAS